MALGSCFFRALRAGFADSFTRFFRGVPAPSAPQAFRVSAELAANRSKLIAAFRSRSMTRPHRSQRKTRSASVKSSSTHSQPGVEQVLLDGSQREARRTLEPYHAALYKSCRLNS